MENHIERIERIEWPTTNSKKETRPDRDRTKEEIRLSLESHKAIGHLVKWKHIEKEDPELAIYNIFCKCCGDQIAGSRQLGQPLMYKVPDNPGTVLLTQQVAQGWYANYREYQINMSDGSRHITHICSSCIMPPMSLELLEAMYAADISVLLDQAVTEQQLHYIDQLSARIPISGEEVPIGT